MTIPNSVWLWPLDSNNKVSSKLDLKANQLFQKCYRDNPILYNILALSKLNRNGKFLNELDKNSKLNTLYKERILDFLSIYHNAFYQKCKDKFNTDQISLLDFENEDVQLYTLDSNESDKRILSYLTEKIDYMRRKLLHVFSILLSKAIKEKYEIWYISNKVKSNNIIPITKLTFYASSQIYDNICYDYSVESLFRLKASMYDTSLLKLIKMWNCHSITIDPQIIIDNLLHCDLYGLMDKIHFIELEFQDNTKKLICNTNYDRYNRFIRYKIINEGDYIPLPFVEHSNKYVYSSSSFHNTITEFGYYIDDRCINSPDATEFIRSKLESLYRSEYKNIVKLFTYENGSIDRWSFDRKFIFTSDSDD